MRVLYLTCNPNLVSTTRSLQGWLLHGRENGVLGCVVVQQEGDLAAWLREERFAVRIDPMPWPDRRNLVRAFYHVLRIARWARRQKVDLIHCNEYNVYPFGSAVAKLARLPVVCHVRCKLDAGFADWTFAKREPEALIWCTPQMRAECGPIAERTVRGARQHVIPLGIDLGRFQSDEASRQRLRREWGVQEDDVVVGMACALRPGKRIDDFLSLAERLATVPRLHFVLAGGEVPGDASYFRSIHPRIESAQRNGSVRWLGHVEPVIPFLEAIDLFVSTSEHESFGMSVCEAMACKKPVTAYAACSVEEVVGSAGVVVRTGDLTGLADAVRRLSADAPLRQSLGSAARDRVATEFNPASSQRQLEAVYRSILNDSGSLSARQRLSPFSLARHTIDRGRGSGVI
ncbi:glycosyltransferase family 4 protein [Candidatus Laterigemmans baculatus]|uniref:glycosyltransferase family 4 protein n=1 Tax=Candidatus Laterigemmans baculatus TaxID=2770505 RepID=UPI0013DA4EF8|nr:glycosyltransferase family 4 protein [Candidatus Laterigemmans baculatus]